MYNISEDFAGVPMLEAEVDIHHSLVARLGLGDRTGKLVVRSLKHPTDSHSLGMT